MDLARLLTWIKPLCPARWISLLASWSMAAAASHSQTARACSAADQQAAFAAQPGEVRSTQELLCGIRTFPCGMRAHAMECHWSSPAATIGKAHSALRMCCKDSIHPIHPSALEQPCSTTAVALWSRAATSSSAPVWEVPAPSTPPSSFTAGPLRQGVRRRRSRTRRGRRSGRHKP